jgi:tetratricopeptide (TPR) repeat protein
MKMKPAIVVVSLLFSFALFAGQPDIKGLPQQDNGKKYGADSVACVMNLSLYREFYKQWKQSKYKNSAIDDAQKPWRDVFENCPRASQNIYLDGAKMLKYRIKKSDNKEVKEFLIDSLMLTYDRRAIYFPLDHKTKRPQKGKILGYKGTDLYRLKPTAYEEAYNILKESVELEKDKSKSAVFVYYFRLTTKMAQKGKIDTAVIVDTYDELMGYVEKNIQNYHSKNNTKKVEEWENVKGNIDNTFEPFANCNDLVRVYQQKFDETPNNIPLLKKITAILDKKKCHDGPLYFEASVNLHKLEPSPESAYLIGKMLMIQERYKDAVPYMMEATKMENEDKRDDAYLFLARIYRATGNYSKARSMALEAAKIDPENGTPYVLIGDMYAASAKDCGTDDLTKKVAYWAAVDKYAKAKRVDASLTDAMNKLITTYRAYFPPTELLFFHNLKEGDSYTVECWINEVTKIRAAK